VKGAAFAACDERVDFFAAAAGWFDGVNDGESTLNVFLELEQDQTREKHNVQLKTGRAALVPVHSVGSGQSTYKSAWGDEDLF
jgi:hypothetical protein